MKQFQSFALDTANQCLLHNGAPIDLAPKPFAVLRYLVENPGRLITHDELLDALWPGPMCNPRCCGLTCWNCARFLATMPQIRSLFRLCPSAAIDLLRPLQIARGRYRKRLSSPLRMRVFQRRSSDERPN